MRLLIDECCTLTLVQAMRETGADVRWVRDICPGADDTVVMALAFAEDRIVVTHDYDLPELAVRHSQPAVGLLLIQASISIAPADIAKAAERVAAEGDALRGRITVLERDRIRTRKL